MKNSLLKSGLSALYQNVLKDKMEHESNVARLQIDIDRAKSERSRFLDCVANTEEKICDLEHEQQKEKDLTSIYSEKINKIHKLNKNLDALVIEDEDCNETI